ncbi:MAG: hypothetical protein M3Y82_05105, partial [Verrucomicrobiota bacterium]|nr:hypothetical protein [Verrucomicrobiota bacterium]
IASLYASDSKWFIDTIYTNTTAKTRFVDFAASITNMSVLVGFESGSNGYGAVTSIYTTDSTNAEVFPFVFKKIPESNSTNFIYLLSAHEPDSSMGANLLRYIDSNTVTNIVSVPSP